MCQVQAQESVFGTFLVSLPFSPVYLASVQLSRELKHCFELSTWKYSRWYTSSFISSQDFSIHSTILPIWQLTGSLGLEFHRILHILQEISDILHKFDLK